MKRKVVRAKIILVLLFACLYIHTDGQTNFNKQWLPGSFGIKVDQRTSIPLFSYANPLVLNRYKSGYSCIADSNGKLILSSDGFRVYDSNYALIPNGDSIGGKELMKISYGFSLFSQASIFLPFPNNKFYFVQGNLSDAMYYSNWQGNTSNYYPFDQLLWSRIELVNGQYEVTSRENKLSAGGNLARTQMMACKHANGIDWWLIKKAYLEHSVYVYLFRENEVIEKGKVNLPWTYNCGLLDFGGMLTFSPDGSEFSFAQNNLCNNIYRCGFDRCTGDITPLEHLQAPSMKTEDQVDSIDYSTIGLCYSPNGRFLYLTRFYGIQQYDFEDKSWYEVSGMDTVIGAFMGYSATYLGLDSSIYIGNWHGLAYEMSTITNPNGKGAACNFCRKCFRLDRSLHPRCNNYPCQPNYDLGKLWCGEDTTVNQPPPYNEVIVPNAFSPNGDERNDVWQIINKNALLYYNITVMECGIYNRWGNRVFTGRGLDFEWNGAHAALDTYHYFIRYKLADGTDKIMKGDITLVR